MSRCCHLPLSLLLLLLVSTLQPVSSTAVAIVAPLTSSPPAARTISVGRDPQLKSPGRRQAGAPNDSGAIDDDAVFPSTLPQVIGLVVPRARVVQVGQNVTFGWLDALPSTGGSTDLPGLFREVTPLVTLPNQTVIVLPSWGSLDMEPPFSSFYPPVYPEGWCAVRLATRTDQTTSWLVKPGMEELEVNLVLNVTWGLPTYTGSDRDTNCSTPARLYKSVFVSSPLSVLGAPAPAGTGPSSSSTARLPPGASTPPLLVSTTLLALSTAIPPWPRSAPNRAGEAAKRALAGLLAGLALACFAAVGTSWYLVRRRRQMGLQDYQPPSAAAAAAAVGGTLLLQPRWASASPRGPRDPGPEYWPPPIGR